MTNCSKRLGTHIKHIYTWLFCLEQVVILCLCGCHLDEKPPTLPEPVLALALEKLCIFPR